MQIKTFSLSLDGEDDGIDEINRFLKTVRVTSKHTVFAKNLSPPRWVVYLEYEPISASAVHNVPKKSERVDYRNVLNENDFAIYCKLRKLRQEIAEEMKLPVYVVFTNEQLAQIATMSEPTLSSMRKIEGIGASRVEKYGAQFLVALKEARGQSASAADGDDEYSAFQENVE